ncbi:MAG: hypothetical protein RBR68_07565 [Tenuifilaceae bacterium]|nr:hypothetical protein [Tenuifilaceae bacterium]
MEQYLQDYEFLKKLDTSHILDVLAKIIILDMNEKPIAEIQGRTLGGQINITNSSSVRRTGNISFLPDERYSNLMDVNQLISLNKKIKIEIGYLNNTNKYLDYPIFWFPLGIFGITGVNESTSSQGHTYFIDFQDKMAFLNGTCGGTFPAAISFDMDNNYEVNISSATRDSYGQAKYILEETITIERGQVLNISGFADDSFNGTWTIETFFSGGLAGDPLIIQTGGAEVIEPIEPTIGEEFLLTLSARKLPIYDIIMQAVSHFGQEQKGNIIIEGIDLRAKNLLKWNGTSTLYITDILGDYTGAAGVLTTTDPGDNTVDSFDPEENIGYEFTNFTFPTDLIAEAGSTVADLLEKIKTTLGNYEYFYGIDGKLYFQEIKNYLNTSLSTKMIKDLEKDDYVVMNSNVYQKETIYNFDNDELIINLKHTPNYNDIKNDFVVWGRRTLPTGEEMPIRYHLAIDSKPIPTEIIGENLEDWRNVLYRQGKEAEPLGLYSNYYYSALKNEWPKLYDSNTHVWESTALNNPETIDYFLDFIDTETQLNELDVKNIGRRTKVVNNSAVNCLFAPDMPNYIIVKSGDFASMEEATNKGYPYIIASEEIYEQLVLGSNYVDAFSIVRELLYQHTQYNSTVTLQTLPIYYLDVNRLISIFNQKLNINGKFIINSITLPLSVNETMSINAVAALKRI